MAEELSSSFVRLAYLLSALTWLKLGIFKNKVLGYGKKIYQ